MADAPKDAPKAEAPKVDAPKPDALPNGAKYEAPKPPPKQNPVFRMMGLPNFRAKLPSRNWMIFFTIVGGWTAAVQYDRREKRKAQKKWCDLVAHISQEPLPTTQLARKLTVFISAPPGDGIRPSREYFKQYIKPVLVAASMDYDVIEGRREGDVRYGTAEQIRRLRRRKGETGTGDQPPADAEQLVDEIRQKLHVEPQPGVRGDLVLGRHTWKEYIRGLHEGWLGPLDEPPSASEPEPVAPEAVPPSDSPDSDLKEVHENTADSSEKKEEEAKEKKKQGPTPSYLPTSAYSTAVMSPFAPSVFEPSQPLHQQHLLGFLKFPIRIYNYLNQRTLAENIGRETAAIVLAAHRPYETSSSVATSSLGLDAAPVATNPPSTDAGRAEAPQTYEQQSVLAKEESTWHKSIRKPRKEGDDSEQIWLKEVVLDPRIADRMRRFELSYDEAERAARIGSGAEKGRAREIDDLRKEKVILGDLDDE